MPARISNITFDCGDALVVATFWSRVLGRPLDPGASVFYCSIGGSDAARAEPALYFEKVPEAKTAKNRVHLDVVDRDPEVVDRLMTLGASLVAEHEMANGAHRWTVMADPEGNEFCVAVTSFVA